MNLFSKNKDFYTTTPELFFEMWHMIPEKSRMKTDYILDPSAGSGFLIEQIGKEHYRRTCHAIEKDPDLIAMLRGKGITVIDNDFLTYTGADKYDIIIANTFLSLMRLTGRLIAARQKRFYPPILKSMSIKKAPAI